MKKLGMSLVVMAVCAAFCVTVVARPADGPAKITGTVIDAKCSANPKMLGNVDCAKKCAAAGEKLVIVADEGGKVYAVDNQASLKGHEGHHITAAGTVTGDSLHVDKVTMMSAPGK